MCYFHRFRQNLSIDIEKYEFLCPLCESLCNSALPLLPTVMSGLHAANKIKSENQSTEEPVMSLDTWLKGLNTVLENKVRYLF